MAGTMGGEGYESLLTDGPEGCLKDDVNCKLRKQVFDDLHCESGKILLISDIIDGRKFSLINHTIL
jgi:hypothetical protein